MFVILELIDELIDLVQYWMSRGSINSDFRIKYLRYITVVYK